MKMRTRYILTGMVIFVVGLPFCQLLIWSFSDRWFYPGLLPQAWGLRAWQYIFGTAGNQIIFAVFQSVAVGAATAGIALVVGFPAGRALLPT